MNIEGKAVETLARREYNPLRDDKKYARFIGTINTSDDDPEGHNLSRSIDDLRALHEEGVIEYAIGSWERGTETNRLHIQVYILLASGKRTRCSWIMARVFRLSVKGGLDSLMMHGIKYCDNPAKPGYVRRALEFGDRPEKRRQGTQSVYCAARDAIYDGEHKTFRDVNDSDYANLTANAPDWVNQQLENRQEDLWKEQVAVLAVMRVWQHWTWRIIENAKPGRAAYFIVDKAGSGGKTTFSDQVDVHMPGKHVCYIRCAPKRDMAESLDVTADVVFLDIPRSKMQYHSQAYTFIEELLDGKVMGEKYRSRCKRFPPPIVIVFMNCDVDIGGVDYIPDHSRSEIAGVEINRGPPLSFDRYRIVELDYELCQPYDPEGQFGTKPFPWKSFGDPDFSEEIEWYPEFKESVPSIHEEPASFGPEFQGDNAGDGPVYPVKVWTKIEVTSRSVQCNVGPHIRKYEEWGMYSLNDPMYVYNPYECHRHTSDETCILPFKPYEEHLPLYDARHYNDRNFAIAWEMSEEYPEARRKDFVDFYSMPRSKVPAKLLPILRRWEDDGVTDIVLCRCRQYHCSDEYHKYYDRDGKRNKVRMRVVHGC